MAKAKEIATVEYDVRPRVIFRPSVYYPESDGEPMAETDTHINQLIYLREALSDYLRDDPNVYVAGNLFVYYEEGDPSQVVAPDVFVVKGVPKRDRRIYQVWKENKGPDVVFELTSRSTWREDLGPKKGTYEMLGVEEYFIFDPLGEHLEPHLMGFRLAEWGYQPIEERPLVSSRLDLELRVEGDMLRLVDPATGEKLLTPLEAQEARRQAEAEVERLRAELACLRGEATE
ncbi:MAG: Uma2 family endonuclease [Chloroflexota bacterium]|nr:Uma2 family endonuclease [Chloroflexota bacterium]